MIRRHNVLLADIIWPSVIGVGIGILISAATPINVVSMVRGDEATCRGVRVTPFFSSAPDGLPNAIVCSPLGAQEDRAHSELAVPKNMRLEMIHLNGPARGQSHFPVMIVRSSSDHVGAIVPFLRGRGIPCVAVMNRMCHESWRDGLLHDPGIPYRKASNEAGTAVDPLLIAWDDGTVLWKESVEGVSPCTCQTIDFSDLSSKLIDARDRLSHPAGPRRLGSKHYMARVRPKQIGRLLWEVQFEVTDRSLSKYSSVVTGLGGISAEEYILIHQEEKFFSLFVADGVAYYEWDSSDGWPKMYCKQHVLWEEFLARAPEPFRAYMVNYRELRDKLLTLVPGDGARREVRIPEGVEWLILTREGMKEGLTTPG